MDKHHIYGIQIPDWLVTVQSCFAKKTIEIKFSYNTSGVLLDKVMANSSPLQLHWRKNTTIKGLGFMSSVRGEA